MPTLHKDYESRSRVDLKSCGAFRYSYDDSTAILLIGLALDDEEVVLWTPPQYREALGVKDDEIKEAERLLKLESFPDFRVFAHNAQFEISLTDAKFERTTGFRPPAHHQWRCTAAMARRAALPHSLEKCAEALGLSAQKDKRGKALIKKFSIPQPDGTFIEPWDDPEAFKEFGEYCRQDVRVEVQIHKALSYFELDRDPFVLQTFIADIEMNVRGFPVNLKALRNAKLVIDEVVAEAEVKFRECTGLTPNQNAKFLAWLKERGYPADNLQADTLDEQIENVLFDPGSEVGRALRLRQQVSFAAVKKIDAMLNCAGPHDNRVRGTLNYYGASTGRWSGSLVQPQNFKRPTISFTEEAYADICRGVGRDHIELMYGQSLEVISSCIRHFIHDDKPFFNADYAAIEARIVCWLAGQEDALQEYRRNLDRYKIMASLIFNKPAGEINKHPERFVGKQATLGCGFGMSGPKFRATCEKYDYYDLPEGLEFKAVTAFREKHDKVVQYWYDCEAAAVRAIKSPGQQFKVRNVSFFCAKSAGIKYLFAVLPSGRKIAYPHVAIEPLLSYKNKKGARVQVVRPTFEQIAKGRKEDPDAMHKDSITYWGKPPGKEVWTRISTYFGRIVENLTQGVAADIMANGTINAEKDGFHTAALIHDEILSYGNDERTVERFIGCLTHLPPWAEGIPVEAEGGLIKFYRK